VCQAKWPEQGWKKVGIGRSEMGDQNWKRVFGGDANRPPARVGVSVSEKSEAWAATVENPAASASPPLQQEIFLVSEKEAAQMLGVSRRKVFELNAKGELPARKIGRRKLYTVSSLKKFAESEVG